MTMKKILAILLFVTPIALFTSPTKAQYQLLNPSFESWEGSGLQDKPNYWSSFPQSDGSWAWAAKTAQHYHRTGGRPGHEGNSYLTIYSRKVLGICANGNMTTGRIYAGSTNPSSSDNYNFTERDSYAHPFEGHPDSMYVWVSFYAADAGSKAAIKAYIHGNLDFRDPNDAGDADNYCGRASTSFTRTTSSKTTPQWEQLHTAFVYDGNSTPNYILMSMTTNAEAGGGEADDSLSVDDIEFVYSAWLRDLQLNWASLNDFRQDVMDYVDTLENTMAVRNATVQPYTQSNYATMRVDTVKVDNHTRRFVVHVVSEDGLTIKDYTMTLYSADTTDCTLAIDDFQDDVNVSVYPNPAEKSLTVETGSGIMEITLTNMAGQQVMQKQCGGEKMLRLDVGSVATGVYIATIRTREGIVSRKFAKK